MGYSIKNMLNRESVVELTLMNKNTPVLHFLYDTETHTVLKIVQIENAQHAPLGIIECKNGITRKKLDEWWRYRSIPASRENITRIMQDIRISSTIELLEKSLGFSLSDQYWVKDKKSNYTWEKLNFFENKFSEDIGRILLGQLDVQQHAELNMISPDNACDGNLLKKWKSINGERYLIKGGNSLNNQEPYNEVIATKLYERILEPDDYVPYFLIQDEGKIFSACKTMVTTDQELVPALSIDALIKKRTSQSFYSHFIEVCDMFQIPDARTKIDKMLTCDYILANYDRHYRNFGAIRDIETLQWVGIAPIYDTGSSLWADVSTNNIRAFSYTSKPFRKNPNEQFELVTDLSWLNESSLEGFEEDVRAVLLENPEMDEQRISRICRNVQYHISRVLDRKHMLE